MTENELKNLLAAVTPPDEAARAAAHAHWAALAKPLGGLGRLEAKVEDAAALTGNPVPDVSRRAVLVLCADNGVVAQGVSQTDAYVTRAVLENLTARRTSVCRMAAAAHCDVVPVDMGIAGAPVPGAADCRIAAGTADFTTGPAMTRAQAVQAIAAGIEEKVLEVLGEKVWRIEGQQNAVWIAMDYVDVVVHIFQTELRGFYRLEELWADAPMTKYEYEE